MSAVGACAPAAVPVRATRIVTRRQFFMIAPAKTNKIVQFSCCACNTSIYPNAYLSESGPALAAQDIRSVAQPLATARLPLRVKADLRPPVIDVRSYLKTGHVEALSQRAGAEPSSATGVLV